MKLLSMIFLFVAFELTATAQNGSKLPPLDKSPMDMSYYPVNYPVLRIQPNKVTEPLIARVIYSRPSKSGRKVFGELVEDGKIWRLGANEATEIEFYRDVKIGGKTVKKGRYTMYALESAAKWTVIINKDTDVWGAFKYDASKDVVRVDCPVTKTADVTESFTMVFEKVNDKSINLIMDWDEVMVKMPISW
ncbi:DUF2911 domain-containing protein [Lacibacter sp. H375]|uniref:DUF2911 domain-containing protein n=1 Tax=Lacibacter sp. H375 TaxID=3133424 RepID=UPI0030BB8B09